MLSVVIEKILTPKYDDLTVGERPGFPKTFSKINTAYQILHHTLIKHHAMTISIS
jgi:hypothetical protein